MYHHIGSISFIFCPHDNVYYQGIGILKGSDRHETFVNVVSFLYSTTMIRLTIWALVSAKEVTAMKHVSMYY